MAKRRRVTAPSADDLARLEAELADGQGAHRPAPIAQVAAESAGFADVRDPATRVEAARDRADAERFRSATEAGLVIAELPLVEIASDAMIRDRAVLVDEELEELADSIRRHGLRLPIEVFALDAPDADGRRYGLLSGYRRYVAVERLLLLTGDERYTRIRALVRDPETLGGAFHAMVAENEVRAQLSPYERGRIAVIAAEQGAFDTVDAAVEGLFASASRAKKSKVRSFALLHEELGEALTYPEALNERQGLRVAIALRNGWGEDLRDALSGLVVSTEEEEWAHLDAALADLEAGPRTVRRGGRPRRARRAEPPESAPLRLASGALVSHEIDDAGHVIRIDGVTLDPGTVEAVLESVRRTLGAAD